MQVLGLPMDILGMAEIKATAIKFLQNRWRELLQTSHLYHGNDAYVNGEGYCHVHNKHCCVSQRPVDITVAGLPCKAFSRLRDRQGNSLRTQSAASHPVYSTVQQFVQYLSDRKPSCFIVEEVESFGHIDKTLKYRGLPESHLQRWARDVCALGYSIKAVRFQHGLYVSCRRPRLVIVGCAPACGGKEAVAWIADAISGAQRRLAMQKPVCIWSLVDPDCAEEERLRQRDLEEKRKQAPMCSLLSC